MMASGHQSIKLSMGQESLVKSVDLKWTSERQGICLKIPKVMKKPGNLLRETHFLANLSALISKVSKGVPLSGPSGSRHSLVWKNQGFATLESGNPVKYKTH